MKSTYAAWCAATCGAVVFAFPAWAAPPASAFGRLPGITNGSISPDGTHIALIAGPPDLRTLTLDVVDSPKSVRQRLDNSDVTGIRWAGDSFLLLGIQGLRTGFNSSTNVPYAYHFQRQLVLNTDGKPLGRLLATSDASNYASHLPILQISDTANPTAVVLGWDWTGGELGQDNNTHFRHGDPGIIPVLWRADMSGGGAIIERGNQNTADWLVDRTGDPRVRIDYNRESHTWTLLGRPKKVIGWTIVDQTTDIQKLPEVLGYSDSEDAVYMVETQGAQQKIVRRALASGVADVIKSSDKAEGLSMRWDHQKMEPVAVITTTDGAYYDWIDPALKAIDAKLSHALKGKILGYEGWSADRSRVLLTVEAPDSPRVWYLFDNAKHTLSPIGPDYPELDGVPMGKVSFYTYHARDGLEIPAYVTLPPGVDEQSARKLPLVVMPHGGPAARDEDRFDWWSQYIASLGYVVLRPQFRGSGGFGESFERAGEHEWGGKMQTDLLDGIADLAAKGVVDPARTCIVGASFGGYAALAGAALHSEAYKCAISVNGVADLGLILGETARRTDADSPELSYWRRVIGDAREDPALITATSPAQQVDRINAPILLIYSEQDTTVPPEQTTIMDHTLRRAGKSVQLVMLPKEDHYFSKSATRTQMLESVGTFLKANLPTGS